MNIFTRHGMEGELHVVQLHIWARRRTLSAGLDINQWPMFSVRPMIHFLFLLCFSIAEITTAKACNEGMDMTCSPRVELEEGSAARGLQSAEHHGIMEIQRFVPSIVNFHE